MAYLDNTGLYRKYGTEKTVPDKGGEYRNVGANRQIEIKGLDLTTLATATETILSDVTFSPKNWIVESVEIWTKTAATGAATLDIGLMATDRTTVIDADGFVTALALAEMGTDGEYHILTVGGTPAGIGAFSDKDTVPTQVGYITAGANGAVYTTGVIDIRINLRPLV